jgi:choline/glycine/proline betaine transport protein
MPATQASPRLNPAVFFSSAVMAGLLGVAMMLYPQASERWLEQAQALVAATFGGYYMLVIAACLAFVIWLAFSPLGQVRLGHDDEQPAFSYLAWISMLFSAGIGIALLYYGAYEPLDHFLSPPQGMGGTPQAARQAMVLTFLHWGLHGWALYALVGVTLGYFAYRKDLPLALRSALYPLFGERIHGAVGHVVDGFGILATLVAMVTNLGIGALVIQSGLANMLHIPATTSMLLVIVGVMMVTATVATALGVERGIAALSRLNIGLLCLLLMFVLACGPTRYLLDGLVQNTGDYLAAFVPKSLDLYLYDPAARRWSGDWTLFYWAWWIGWAPFVGMFIARISRGRRIGEVVRGVLLIPLGFTLAWLSIFGNSAIDLVLGHSQVALGAQVQAQPAMALFKLLEYLPLTHFVTGASIAIAFVLFLTPVDSGTLMIANLSSRSGGGGEDAPVWLRIFWAAVITMVSAGLLLAGSFHAMQIAVVLCGLPFSVVLLLYMVGLYKALKDEAP